MIYKTISTCLALALLSMLSSFAIAAEKKYKDDTITFHYPEDWEIITEKNNGEIRLRPKDWLKTNEASEIETEDFAIYISISDQALAKAAESRGFTKQGTKWKLEGRHGVAADVEEIKEKTWKGILGEAPVGLFFKKGGYAGLGWATTAVISNGRKTVVLRGSEVAQILHSIEFINDK